MRIDLNCDLGEGGREDETLLSLITSANIACGGHAGDDATMARTVGWAQAAGVAIGAHPGYEDRVHFGRRPLALPPREVRASVRRQLEAFCAHAKPRHVKPHGALYLQAAQDAFLAEAIALAVKDIAAEAILYGPPGSRLLEAGEAAGLRVAAEGFADRRYLANGSLAPRSLAGSVIDDPAEGCRQVLELLRHQQVRALSGAEVPLAVETICVHGDTPGAVGFLRQLRTALREAGVELKALS